MSGIETSTPTLAAGSGPDAGGGLRRLVGPLLFVAALAVLPAFVGDYAVGILVSILIQVMIGIGMMVLVGYSGQVSIGHAAFLALGAYGEALLCARGVSFPLSMVAVVAGCALIGVLIGLPSLRFSGLYLAMATLAFAFIVEAMIGGVEITGGQGGMSVDDLSFLGRPLRRDRAIYPLALALVVAVWFLCRNLVGSRTGRAWCAIRDSEIAAASMGIDIARYKTLAFMISAGITGMAGTLLAHKVGYLSPDGFTISQSIEMLILVVVGGLGTLAGAIWGALFIVLVPVGLSIAKDHLPRVVGEFPGLESGVFGATLMLVILFQPKGIAGGVTSAIEALRRRFGANREDRR